MSAFSRFHLPASRRAYSYFSSRSGGGGRYFNSSKPPKPPVVTNGNPKVDPSAEGKKDNVQGAPNGVSSSPITDPSSSPLHNASSSASGLAGTGTEGSNNLTPQSTTSLSNAFAEFSQSNNVLPHQAISAQDFKMHQFFSLHRPLLLISQPASIFRPVPPNLSIFTSLQPETEAEARKKMFGLGTDGASDLFIDADAEAARQLTRALTMSKAGATMSWETTLKQLGLDVAKDADRVNLQEQFDREWEDVMMDSTKRKRRKKMKKHKLKKRRRATRSERMKLK